MSATTHRTTAYFDSPDLRHKPDKTPPEPQLPEPQPVPVGPVAKLVALSDAYFEALQLLRTHLKHPDPKIAGRAAMKIMDVQLATIRHKTNVLGTTLPDDVRPFEIPDELVSSQYGEAEDEEQMDPTEAEVRRQCINMYLTQKQRNADRRGLGEYISWSEARYEYDHRRECWPTRSPHPPHELIPPLQKPLRE